MMNLSKKLQLFLQKIKILGNKDYYQKKRNIYIKNCYLIVSVTILFIIIWACSGFYTIKEEERGVVLRFGKFHHIVQPGLNWKPIFIDSTIIINTESVRELESSGMILTSDENIVRVEMNIQYRIIHPEQYLFNVVNVDDSLREATDSALRGVIGNYTMDRILTEDHTVIRSEIQRVLEETIAPYKMGINLLDVNFQTGQLPEEVKSSFYDVIAARENEQQYIHEAESYAHEAQLRANGHAQMILEEGRAYKIRTILSAQGEILRFMKILPIYKETTKFTKERIYIEIMERILQKNQKIFLNENFNVNTIIVPIDQLQKNNFFNKNIKFNEHVNTSSLKEETTDNKNNVNLSKDKNNNSKRTTTQN